MRHVAVLASTLLVVGCNGVLGLDSTRVEDRDDDGVIDSLDNCPGDSNEDQADTDDDGIGDVCDTCTGCAICTVGPPHDEDGDAVADGCDNCPTVANVDQANTDDDDLGDACDADNATAQRRLVFDGFGSLDVTRWTQSGGSWEIVDDAVVPVDDGPHDLGFQLVLRDTPITGTSPWTFETAFTLPGVVAANDQIGVYLDDANAVHKWPCVLTYDGASWTLPVGTITVIDLGTGPQKLVASSHRDGVDDRNCQINSQTFTDGFFVGSYPFAGELFTRVIAPFAYVEVIQ